MQVADLHYSVSVGACRDTATPCTGSDNLTNTLLGRMLDIEKPDLVVFTGDQLNGQTTTWDGPSVLAKFARAVTERGIPWAAVFGNHDDEDGISRAAQVKYMQGLPYSLVERGPKDVHGVGNYVLKVWSADRYVCGRLPRCWRLNENSQIQDPVVHPLLPGLGCILQPHLRGGAHVSGREEGTDRLNASASEE